MSTDTRRPLVRAGTMAMRTVLIAAIAITVFVAYGLVNNAWYHVLAVQGGSMEPAISAGDLIIITRPPEHIEVGQVLTLQVDGAIVTHRVVEVRPDGTFVTQGDANDSRDDFSANDVHVIGEFRFSLPVLGMLVEPLVSGAWFTDGSEGGGSASSGTWPMLSALRIDRAGGRIVWNAPLPAAIPLPGWSDAPSPMEEGAATASPSEAAPPSDESNPIEGSPPGEDAVPSREASPREDASPSEAASPSAKAIPSEAPAPSDTPAPSEDANPSEAPAPSEEPSAP